MANNKFFDWHPPKPSHRATIIGSTGSGKSTLGLHLLSMAPFDKRPYIALNYKREEMIDKIPGIRPIGVGELPKRPGVYVMHPLPKRDDDAIEKWLYHVWERTNVGIFADEAYMLPSKGALETVLTQGRTLRIPAIMCTQRPAWLSRFCFSEADHVAVFRLNDEDDRRTVKRFLPSETPKERLAEHNCWWYDQGRDALFRLLPCPNIDSIHATFAERLRVRRRVA